MQVVRDLNYGVSGGGRIKMTMQKKRQGIYLVTNDLKGNKGKSLNWGHLENNSTIEREGLIGELHRGRWF